MDEAGENEVEGSAAASPDNEDERAEPEGESSDAAGKSDADASEMAERVVEFVNQASTRPELAERLGFADTVVSICVTGDDGGEEAGCTLRLSDEAVEAETGTTDDAEITIRAPAGVWGDVIGGRIILAMAIARGDVTYEGPVRKFLRVTPLLRALDFDVFGGTSLATQAEGGPESLSADAHHAVERVRAEYAEKAGDDEGSSSENGEGDEGEDHAGDHQDAGESEEGEGAQH